MIQITTARWWFVVIAATVNDNRDVFVAAGLTRRAAERRLLKTMDDHYKL